MPVVKPAGEFWASFVLSWSILGGNDSSVFSGIIETSGRVVGRELLGGGGLRLEVDGSGLADWPVHGASIAVQGCCLTVARLDRGSGVLGFDVVPETVGLTTLGEIQEGDRVNLEASVRPTTRLDGHVVQGHVEGLGEVVEVVTPEAGNGGEWRLAVRAPTGLMPCIVPKGSIAIDGVSLTIARVDLPRSRFEVALIPTTLDLTTLGDRRVGDRVHLETDILARTAVHWLTHFGHSYSRPEGER